MWRCFVRDQARVPSVAGAGSSLFRKTEQFFLRKYQTNCHDTRRQAGGTQLDGSDDESEDDYDSVGRGSRRASGRN